MTNNSFIQIIRDYAQIARKRGRSYAEPVNELLAMQLQQVEQSSLTDADKSAQKAFYQDVVTREYAQFDSNYEPLPQS